MFGLRRGAEAFQTTCSRANSQVIERLRENIEALLEGGAESAIDDTIKYLDNTLGGMPAATHEPAYFVAFQTIKHALLLMVEDGVRSSVIEEALKQLYAFASRLAIPTLRDVFCELQQLLDCAREGSEDDEVNLNKYPLVSPDKVRLLRQSDRRRAEGEGRQAQAKKGFSAFRLATW